MNRDNYNDKIENAIRQSAEKITPPPFGSVKQKIACDNSTESYEEFFVAESPKKKNTALKIAGIAAALVVLSAAGSVVAVMNKSISESADVGMNYQLSKDYSEESSTEEDTVSDSDCFACQSSDTCNDEY